MESANNTPAVQDKPKAIVAGIINTLTGELSDMISNPSAKTRLHLKVRDELNAQHGEYAFMVFELNSMGGLGNLDYVQRHMQSDDPSLMKEVRLLKARHALENIENSMDRVIGELSLVNETMNDCLALYGDGQAAKREIIEDALSNEVSDLESEIESLKTCLSHQKRKVRQLESD